MTSSTMRKSEVGELRPSQVLTTYGIGSLVDLPNLSVMVMGLESWPDAYGTEIGEERLLYSSVACSNSTTNATPRKSPRGCMRRRARARSQEKLSSQARCLT